MVIDKTQPAVSMDKNPKDQDLTGKNRRVYNVMVGWLGQLVFVASGFILPRMIDTNLGKETLGVWDFAWSLITYFEFIYGSLTSSVSRFVAKHRAVGDIDGVSRAVSSAFFVLLFLALLVALLSSCIALFLPYFMQSQLGAQTKDAQWVIFFLGAGLAVKIGLAVFGGILTGCHRWDVHHGINTANRLVTLLGMIAVLKLGGGLPVLAFVYLCLETLVVSSRCSLVFRICPGLRINPRLAHRNTALNMWRFGLKTLLPDLGDLLSNQTFNLFLVWFLGPVALASYNRPRGLVRNIQVFVRRYAFTLIPTASSLQAMSAEKEIRELFIRSCQTGAYIVFPMFSVLVIDGGPILQIWMGPKYADNILPAVLAFGYLPFLLQLPLNSLLQGFNSHGWPGLFKFIASVTGIGSAFIALNFFHSSATGAAIALFLPFWISEFIATPLFAAKKQKFSLRQYWLSGILKPLLLMTPMILCLLAFRFVYAAHPIWMLLVGIPASLSCFAISYWFFGVTPAIQKKINSFFQFSRYFKNQSS
ncbi:MAG: oligosaccharide flippase family protein [Gammaproteobacteria bacterium]|nr:oligosaccharide flippase family protein [Gammaproteobacteria bacterium]